jgi:hypothetical protein
VRHPSPHPVGPDERAVYNAISAAEHLTQDRIAKATGVRGPRLDDVLTVLLIRRCLRRLGPRDLYGVGPMQLDLAAGS